jgi:hypothetical protein
VPGGQATRASHPVSWRRNEPLHLVAQAFKGPRNVDFNIKAMHDTVSYVPPPLPKHILTIKAPP